MQTFFVGLSLPVVIMFGSTLYGQDLSNKINMLEIVISNLVTRVEALEKRINTLEKNSSGVVSKPQKKDVPIKDSSKSSPTNGFEDIGNGFFVKNILSADNSIKYTGCDFSEIMVDEARKQNVNFIASGQAKFLKADANELPFEKETFSL